MQILTPEKIRVLEMFAGVRAPAPASVEARDELAREGFLQPDPFHGAGMPTEIGVRAVHPQFMKDITPCN